MKLKKNTNIHYDKKAGMVTILINKKRVWLIFSHWDPFGYDENPLPFYIQWKKKLFSSLDSNNL